MYIQSYIVDTTACAYFTGQQKTWMTQLPVKYTRLTPTLTEGLFSVQNKCSEAAMQAAS